MFAYPSQLHSLYVCCYVRQFASFPSGWLACLFVIGSVRLGNLTPEEAELLFRRAFGGVSLDEILRQALNQHNATRWGAGAPYLRNDVFEHQMGSRPSTSFLDDREIYEILRDLSGGCLR